MLKKCSTDQRFIRKRDTTYRIGTLASHTHCIFLTHFILKDDDFCFSGELKERNLLLWFVPKPLLKMIGYMCGEKYYSSTDTSCSRCTAIFSVFLVPLAAAIGKFSLHEVK